MKFCLINNLYKPYNRGGADKVVENISNGLEETGHEVFVISTKPFFSKCLGKDAGKNYYLPSIFPYLNKMPKIIRLFWHFWDCFNFINYFKIKSIINREKPNLVITHNLKGLGLLIPLAIKKSTTKHIHYLHDIQLLHPSGLMFYGKEKKTKSFSAKIYASISNYLFNSPEIIISPSQWLLDLYIQNKFFKKSKKIKLLNPAIINKEEKQKKIQERNIFKFLYVGEIEEHKGINLLVESFIELNKKNIELTIIGKGSQIEKIKRISQNNKNIKILGWQKNENVRKNMQEADVFLMTSTCYENSPTVIYEAIGDNLPVIASNIGGIPELINKFGGLLFEPENKTDLKNKITYCVNNYKEIKKTSLEGRQKIKELSLKNYIKKLLQIIN